MDRKMTDIRKNNSGFTLLELVISVAIMSLIVIIGGQFMVTSANSYSTLQRSVSLSQASKQVTEQMSENSIDSSAAVVCPVNSDGSGDVIVYFLEYPGQVGSSGGSSKVPNTQLSSKEYLSRTGQNLYDVHAYKYNSSNKVLEYGELKDHTLDPSLAADVNGIKYETLCENFDDNGFRYEIETSSSESAKQKDKPQITYADRIDLTFALKKRDKEFRSESDVTFRGGTVWTETFDDLAKEPYLEEVNER